MLRHQAPHISYDLLFLSETWLSSSVHTAELRLQNFNIYRSDRSPENNSFKSVGGGVLIAVSNRVRSCRWVCRDGVEHLFVTLPDHKLILGCVYLPDYQPASVYDAHFDEVDAISTAFPDFNLILVGDYNVPGVDWLAWSNSASPPHGPKAKMIFDAMNLLNLSQCNHLANPAGNVLDLLLSSFSEVGETLSDPLINVDVAHPPFEFIIPSQSFSHAHFPRSQFTYNFRKANYPGLLQHLGNIDWSFCSSVGTVDAVSQFYDVIADSIELFVPKSVPINSSFPRWFTPDLINLTRRKRTAHSRYKITNSVLDYNVFSDLRRSCKSLSNSLYREYIEEVQCSVQTNVKKFWNFVNYKTGSNDLPQLMGLGDKQASTPLDIANLFAEHFSSVFVPPTHFTPNYPSLDLLSFGTFTIAQADVLRELKSLKPEGGMGPDGVPPMLLQACASVLAPPLTDLFNGSLSSGLFPSVWKCSFVTPVHKSGSKSSINHYRPICTISTIPKLFEKLVSLPLYSIISPILSPSQHGFLKGRSTVSNLLEFQEYVLQEIGTGGQVDVISMDFAKAFDRLSHEHLAAKLESIGLFGSLLAWLKDYLTGRTMVVRIRNAQSYPFPATSGVPQGSHLGPLLFLVLIDSVLDSSINTHALLFADDLKLFNRVDAPGGCQRLQDSLVALSFWCDQNSLHLNPAKCTVTTFCRGQRSVVFTYMLGDAPLRASAVLADLGVTFGPRFDFTGHIDEIAGRAMRALGFLKRNT
ncbi:unnamed protein product, partial [Nesidiocoris tenuis]